MRRVWAIVVCGVVCFSGCGEDEKNAVGSGGAAGASSGSGGKRSSGGSAGTAGARAGASGEASGGMGGEAGTSTPNFGGAVATGGVGGEGGVGGAATMGGVAGSATGGDSASGAGAGPISCEASFTTDTNDKGIGAGCAQINPPIEVAACPGKFSIARVLSDRWPKAENGQLEFGFCTKHCEIDSDCGTGFGCCEPRKGAFCLPYVENVLLPTGCTEPCATNHLNCGEGEICCERLGKVCVSDKCSGICPE